MSYFYAESKTLNKYGYIDFLVHTWGKEIVKSMPPLSPLSTSANYSTYFALVLNDNKSGILLVNSSSSSIYGYMLFKNKEEEIDFPKGLNLPGAALDFDIEKSYYIWNLSHQLLGVFDEGIYTLPFSSGLIFPLRLKNKNDIYRCFNIGGYHFLAKEKENTPKSVYECNYIKDNAITLCDFSQDTYFPMKSTTRLACLANIDVPRDTYTTSELNDGLHFTSYQDIIISQNLQFSQYGTIELVFKFDEIGTNKIYLFNTPTGSIKSYTSLEYYDNTLTFWSYNNSSSGQYINKKIQFDINTVYSISFGLRENDYNMFLYINGELIEEKLNPDLLCSTSSLNYFSYTTSSSNFHTFRGHVYGIRTYDRGLSKEEVKQNFLIDKQKFNIK